MVKDAFAILKKYGASFNAVRALTAYQDDSPTMFITGLMIQCQIAAGSA